MIIAIIITSVVALALGAVGGIFLCLLYLISEKCSDDTWETVSSIHARNHKITEEKLREFIL
jgi:hypothetical protein